MGGVIRTDFLVYGECSCGWHCACPEGYRWPKCPNCKVRVMPERSTGRAYGYVAQLMDEQEAFARPEVEDSVLGREFQTDPRLYAPEEIERARQIRRKRRPSLRRRILYRLRYGWEYA